MRPVWSLLVLLPLLPITAAHGAEGDPHSANVRTIWWDPSNPQRDQAVNVHLLLYDGRNVSQVLLIQCRVQSYACKQPVVMTRAADAARYDASVAWDASFMRGVTQAGYQVLLKYANGTEEKSPVMDWPSRPVDLPPEAGFYYYYSLPPEPGDSPAPAFLGVLAAVTVLALARRLRGSP